MPTPNSSTINAPRAPVAKVADTSSTVLWRNTLLFAVLGFSAELSAEDHGENQRRSDEDKATSAPPRFNSNFLFGGSHSGDLQAFLAGGDVLPGDYRVDVLVNQELIGRRDVNFASPAPGLPAVACITLRVLENAPIRFAQLQAQGLVSLDQQDECLNLPKLIEFSTVDYDANRLQLSISIPQASISAGPRGYVSPELWDAGVAAGFINYNFSARGNQNQGRNSDNLYLGLNNGFNLGMWRFRNDLTISQSTDRPREFTSNRTYAERDITPLRSQLSVGETYDNAQIFDSFRFRGFTLRSDDSMLPDSERGYAPVIRGTAETNATVEIRQNNYLLSSTEVSPGPFVISDIFPSGSNGDLEITVIEADGRQRVTTQAFAALPRMVRENSLRYTLAAGQYGQLGATLPTPRIMTTSLTYGLTSETTVYGGMQWSENYRAGNLGLTRNTPIGAISTDVTQSLSDVGASKQKGQSLRMLYAKTLTQTNTTLTLASYRYSTEGYRTLSDHVRDLASPLEHPTGRARSRFDLTINQTLGKARGSLYLTSSQQRYWNLPGGSQQLQAGYANQWEKLNYNVNLSHSRSANSDRSDRSIRSSLQDTSLNLTLSLPIGGTSSNTRVSASLNARRSGDYSLQSGVNGRFMGDPDSHYSVRAGTEKGRGETTSATLSTRTSVASFNAGYSAGANYSTTSVGATGSVVAHAGGINLGLPVGDTFALAEVKGIEGARLANTSGAKTGSNGFAIVPNVTPYRNNWVRLDTRDLGADIEIENPSQQVIPRRGSVTKAMFTSQQGRRVQFELRHPDGSNLPFGAVVVDVQGNELGIVDPFSSALALVTEDAGVVTVKSGGKACEVEYQLPEKQAGVFYEHYMGVCR